MNKNIGILLISTWKYNKFIDEVVAGIRKYFFPNNEVKIYLHTDSDIKHDVNHIINIKHEKWPYVTLKKFHIFHQNKNVYTTDYLISIDVDIIIKDYINTDILHDLIAVYHSNYYMCRGTPETNPASTAFIPNDCNHNYVCGGFFGGKKDCVLDMCSILSANIDVDLNHNFIAKWHDESHLNKYVFDNKDKFKILEPEYMNFSTDRPTQQYLKYHKGQKTYKAKIIALQNSQKAFDKFE